ncbi:MAG: magnesium transporter [Solobacterium sp.]|jgi:magnesium transporter|nr:magnesium transporter [Solobacterium sp.]MCH4049267.1 magnesium transporter [Solobacterium sp.]MCH4075123.1 magnesium transporter [Solobacterium sp.]MCI1313524.1 magnesium transporter [Solobacterium sp.]MCI1407439.1 magnesium transporter [Solobacterium sp.]
MTEENMEETEELRSQQLCTLIHEKNSHDLETWIKEEKAIDVAQAARDLEPEEMEDLLSLISDRTIALILEQGDDDERVEMAEHISANRLLAVMEYMQKDDIVDLLGDLPIGRRKQLVDMMKADDRRTISALLQYPSDSAGGLMTTAYIALKDELTVDQGLARIREIGPKTEVIETIFIIDEKRRLTGWCDLRDLLSASKQSTLHELMHEDVISVAPETDQEETARIVSKYDLKALPVVSSTNQILGIITVDDIIDVIVEEYDEDMLQMAGVSKEESLDTTLGESIRLRLPWLLINLATAFLASFTVAAFQGTISKVVALSSIMTIVSGMGGNAGTQTTSIMIRALAQKKLKFKDCIRPFFKEILLSIIDGAVCGVATAIVVHFMYGNNFLCLIVVISMIGNLLVAGIFGFLIPLILNLCHADPAVASSIFLTTATDVLGFFIFLGLATLFLPYIQ